MACDRRTALGRLAPTRYPNQPIALNKWRDVAHTPRGRGRRPRRQTLGRDRRSREERNPYAQAHIDHRASVVDLVFVQVATPARAAGGAILPAGGADAAPDRYIGKVKNFSTTGADTLASCFAGAADSIFSTALNGISITLSNNLDTARANPPLCGLGRAGRRDVPDA